MNGPAVPQFVVGENEGRAIFIVDDDKTGALQPISWPPPKEAEIERAIAPPRVADAMGQRMIGRRVKLKLRCTAVMVDVRLAIYCSDDVLKAGAKRSAAITAERLANLPQPPPSPARGA